MKPARERIVDIIKILRREYPRARTSLRHKSVFELLISTILAAQCTDERVNKITPSLFGKFRGPAGFARAKQSDLEKSIYSAGFYKNKARNIIAASKKIEKEFNGRVPDTMEGLTSLAGVARKTANIVLSAYFHKAEGIAVDTHVKRLSRRLGLTRQENPNRIEKDLMSIVPRRDWLDFNYILVNHGRRICVARKPLCPVCVIKHLCTSAKYL
ncbi:MAG: endonuclease III [Candidatus Omnitrophica bacterium]|nr:endonuclease III [Candidatus Omnitrophota bacterium]